MLWKELYVERAGTLGRLGRWLGLLVIVPIGGGSLLLAAVVGWTLVGPGNPGVSSGRSIGDGRSRVGDSPLAGWLIQWAIGMRAAVSIAWSGNAGHGTRS